MDLYQYVDYREFIRDYFRERKLANPNFSMAAIGQKTGLTKVAVKYVIDGARHIASEKIALWSATLGLKGEKAEYFRQLVMFNKSRNHAERTLHFDRLLAIKGNKLQSQFLDGSSIGYFQAWYFPAIAEMSYLEGFRPDPAWIKRRLRFPVSEAKIGKALTYLSSQGYLKGSNASAIKVKTPDQIRSHIYKAFVLTQNDLSSKATEEQSEADRATFTLTISVSPEKYAVAKRRLAEIRHELHDLLAAEETAERVIQINLNMFTVAAGDSNA